MWGSSAGWGLGKNLWISTKKGPGWVALSGAVSQPPSRVDDGLECKQSWRSQEDFMDVLVMEVLDWPSGCTAGSAAH